MQITGYQRDLGGHRVGQWWEESCTILSLMVNIHPHQIILYVGQKFNDDIVKISAEICGQDP